MHSVGLGRASVGEVTVITALLRSAENGRSANDHTFGFPYEPGLGFTCNRGAVRICPPFEVGAVARAAPVAGRNRAAIASAR